MVKPVKTFLPSDRYFDPDPRQKEVAQSLYEEVANAPLILERLGSTDKRLIWFERSGHAITVDLEHDALYETVLNWLNAH